MKKKNYLTSDLFDFNAIDEDKNFASNPINRKQFFSNLFKMNKNIYGTTLSKDDLKKRKKQIIIVCFLGLFTIGSIAGGTIAIIKAQDSSKPKIISHNENF